MSYETSGEQLRRAAARRGFVKAAVSIGSRMLPDSITTPLGRMNPLTVDRINRDEQAATERRIKSLQIMLETAEALGEIAPVPDAPRDVSHKDTSLLVDHTAPDIKSWG